MDQNAMVVYAGHEYPYNNNGAWPGVVYCDPKTDMVNTQRKLGARRTKKESSLHVEPLCVGLVVFMLAFIAAGCFIIVDKFVMPKGSAGHSVDPGSGTEIKMEMGLQVPLPFKASYNTPGADQNALKTAVCGPIQKVSSMIKTCKTTTAIAIDAAKPLSGTQVTVEMTADKNGLTADGRATIIKDALVRAVNLVPTLRVVADSAKLFI